MKKTRMIPASALLLTASMLVSACGSSDGTASTAQEPVKQGETKPAAPVKFTVMLNGSNLPTPDKDLILQQLNKDLNMAMEMSAIPSDYDQQLNVKIAGGTPPDVFGVSKVQLQKYGEQGLLLELDKYTDKLPNLKQAYKENDWNNGKVNGKLYAIAKRPDIPMNSYWIRKDWLDKLGLKPPTTLEEFKKVLVAFTNEDPDGNGKKDTYGLTGNGFSAFNGIFAAYGLANPNQWMIQDNKPVYAATDPRMKDALGYIADLIQAGAVDPELMANQGTIDQEKAFKGMAGVLYRNWGELTKDNEVANYKKINPKAEWLQSGSLTGPGGTYAGFWDQGRTAGRIALSKTLENQPEKLNKILEYLNYITEPGKGQMIVNYGVEGTHYKMENGKVAPLPAMADTSYASLIQLTGRTELEYLSVKFAKQKPYIDFAVNLPRIKTYNEFISLPQGVVADDKIRYETEELTKFMYNKRPLSEFNAFVDTLNKTYQLPLYVKEAEKSLKGLKMIQ